MPVFDVLLVHVGSREKDGTEGISMPPWGLFALADHLKRQGVRTGIFVRALAGSKGFDHIAADLLAEYSPALVGLPLFWHRQSAEVLRFAGELKRVSSSLPVVVGGLTASIFAEEILEASAHIDYVIKGDGEVPLYRLWKALNLKRSDMSGVPNLVWRKEGRVCVNKAGYTATRPAMDAWDCTDFSALLNPLGALFKVTAEGSAKGKNAVFFGPTRGCPGSCSFCGGNRRVHREFFGRRGGFQVMSQRRAAERLRQMPETGADALKMTIYCQVIEAFYLKIFRSLKKPLPMSFLAGTFGLPSGKMLELFRRSFTGDVTVSLLPDTGCAVLRRKIKSFAFSNKELWAFLDKAGRVGIKVRLDFLTGLPFETPASLKKTLAMIVYLKRKYPGVEMNADFLELEPGSPMFFNESRFGVRLRLKRFRDFVSSSALPRRPGFRTDAFSEEEIVDNARRLQAVCCRTGLLADAGRGMNGAS